MHLSHVSARFCGLARGEGRTTHFESMNHTSALPASRKPAILGLGFTLLDTGASVCFLFPFVPSSRDARMVGQSLRITTDAGDLVFDEIGPRARQAASEGKLLAVGVDALSRPVFESDVAVAH